MCLKRITVITVVESIEEALLKLINYPLPVPKKNDIGANRLAQIAWGEKDRADDPEDGTFPL